MSFKNGLFWIIASIVTAFNLLFCFISLIEIYQVSFTSKEKEYHWGAEPFPWYYETKMTYLTYTGSWAVLFLSILFFQIFYLLKRNKTREMYSGLLFILLFAIMLVVNGPMN